MGLYKNMGLYAGMGLSADTNIVLLKSANEVRSTLLKATVQTKTTDDCVEMYKKKTLNTRTTYRYNHHTCTWYDQESIIYGLMVQFRPMGLYDEAL